MRCLLARGRWSRRRWDKVAEGLGCHGEYVERIEDLDGALERSRGHDGPSLICIRSYHDANLNVPADMLARFFEVYNGPAAAEPEASADALVPA